MNGVVAALHRDAPRRGDRSLRRLMRLEPSRRRRRSTTSSCRRTGATCRRGSRARLDQAEAAGHDRGDAPRLHSRKLVRVVRRRRLAALVGAAWWAWQATRPRAQTPAESVGRPNYPYTRLTFGPELQTDPAFSPDGKFIAYASDRAGNFDIWVQALSGEASPCR